jgi:dipeptidyl aminopeptidase/acylaminoacyl peptidase
VDHEILRVDAAGGEPTVVTVDRDFFDYNTSAMPAFGVPRVSPDGSTVLFRSWRSGWINYWTVPLTGGTPAPVAPEAADHSNAVWSPDGRSVAFTANHNGTHDLRVVSAERSGSGMRFGAARTLVSPALGVVNNIAWDPAGRQISYTLASPTRPADLFVVNVSDGASKQITSSIAREISDQLITPEKISYRSDTLTIHAYLYKPRNATAGQRFPAIVFGHGGPTSQYGDTYDQQMQYFVSQGYVVLAPNFRGSSGYGRAFADLNNKCWAHCDLADLVAGVEYLKKQPYISGKFGATGSSHGGLLAMAAATFAPGVFHATIASGGTADRIYYYNTQELRHLKQADNEFGPLKGNEETYRYVSPFYYAKDVNTPIFVIWGEGRWPGSLNSKNYVTELERFYKTHRAKVYQGENYYVSTRANVRQMLLDMTDFFDQYLKTDKTPGAATSSLTQP